MSLNYTNALGSSQVNQHPIWKTHLNAINDLAFISLHGKKLQRFATSDEEISHFRAKYLSIHILGQTSLIPELTPLLNKLKLQGKVES